ncbi:hypothetical protein Adt_42100 [Abeliophyllum distichum]|uniref:Uncharacterized protein n=1 Tax=Abeliophyllum distichum TaxID=126358 RepID=A0ABD1PQP6_9LAMI
MDEEEVFYVKAIPKEQESFECKFEVLFILNFAQTVTGDKDDIKNEGKASLHEDGSPHLASTYLIESPPKKIYLFQSHDTPVANKKKFEKPGNEDEQKKTPVKLHILV